ncbi:tRNA pseudouridine synthase-like 1 isoform X1 [Nomascus leucogenys]|uniref:tRNA pseudouridine synthase-like 1 isoform X1 n=1 Tax=Nomascus leucogenys TaxID=61853 RepID=UPI00122D754D|nr:tRNA pseudouridine synthase-like 1 isoform X1 [Nomascus leucogenys]
MSSAPASGSVRARYLVYFQYLGTDFNGVAAVRGTQRAVGVQNYLEEAAERLNSVEPVRFTISSRTDAGVHALSNAAHLDVQRRSGRPPFPPEVLTEALNTHLRHPAIRVLRAFRVPNDFHARHAATSRTYLYRLATGCNRRDELPVFERNLCWALPADCLDVVAMQEAAQHLLGTHDFSAFQSTGSPVPSPVRTLRRVSVSPGQASPLVTQESRKLRFWSLEFESQSFLYRQVLPPAPCRGHSSGATDDPGHSAKVRPHQVQPCAGQARAVTAAWVPQHCCLASTVASLPGTQHPGHPSPSQAGWGTVQDTAMYTKKRVPSSLLFSFYWKCCLGPPALTIWGPRSRNKSKTARRPVYFFSWKQLPGQARDTRPLSPGMGPVGSVHPGHPQS